MLEYHSELSDHYSFLCDAYVGIGDMEGAAKAAQNAAKVAQVATGEDSLTAAGLTKKALLYQMLSTGMLGQEDIMDTKDD